MTLQAASDGLARGYTVIQNDLGHSSTNGTDWSFAIKGPGQPNVEAIIDFGHRATHVATVSGKEIVARFYGRAAQADYWQGCSTGGRQGLAEVQRYPTDYDGVIAGAPVYSPRSIRTRCSACRHSTRGRRAISAPNTFPWWRKRMPSPLASAT